MSLMQKENDIGSSVPARPSRRYSRSVRFVDEVARVEPDPTSVEIFTSHGKWYCQVRRGDEKTRPMGPYTERQAQLVQDARKRLLARTGTSRLLFK